MANTELEEHFEDDGRPMHAFRLRVGSLFFIELLVRGMISHATAVTKGMVQTARTHGACHECLVLPGVPDRLQAHTTVGQTAHLHTCEVPHFEVLYTID